MREGADGRYRVKQSLIRRLDQGQGWSATLLEGWVEVDHMGVLNLSYDLTPQEFITVIVTDVGNIPTTSVPVIIREFIAEGVPDDQ